jgi:hypothetical protein
MFQKLIGLEIEKSTHLNKRFTISKTKLSTKIKSRKISKFLK